MGLHGEGSVKTVYIFDLDEVDLRPPRATCRQFLGQDGGQYLRQQTTGGTVCTGCGKINHSLHAQTQDGGRFLSDVRVGPAIDTPVSVIAFSHHGSAQSVAELRGSQDHSVGVFVIAPTCAQIGGYKFSQRYGLCPVGHLSMSL